VIRFSSGLCSALLLASHCLAQKPLVPALPAAAVEPQPVMRTLNFGVPKPLPNLANAISIGYPIHCSPDGDSYLQVYGIAGSVQLRPFPDTYRISHLGDVQKLTVAMPQGYLHVSARDFYAGSRSTVYLLWAHNAPSESAGDVKKLSAMFLSIADSDGGHARVEELELAFDPLKIAALDSGDFLVLGIDTVNRVPALALLHSDGAFWKYINIDNRDYDASGELRKMYPAQPPPPPGGIPKKTVPENAIPQMSEVQLQRSLRTASFVPFGNNVLLVQPGSSMPLRLLSDKGDLGDVTVSLPPGLVFENALASNDAEILVLRLRTVEDIAELTKAQVLRSPKDQILTFSRRTGKPLEAFSLQGARTTEVTCATDHKLTAVFYVPTEGPISAPIVDGENKPAPPPMQPVIGFAPFAH
jgi:hypothetical protein